MRKTTLPLAAIILFLMILSSCCPSSRIILLDSGKTENAIVVGTENGELVLNEPNTFTTISTAARKPAAARKLSPQTLKQEFGEFIASAPKPPQRFLLYFKTGSTTLTDKSQKLFPEIKQTIRERIPCDVNIIGHTDRLGSREYNIKLSLERARWVYDWLQKANIDIKDFVVESYGEEDPLIPTPDGVAEPRNRRVEILIR